MSEPLPYSGIVIRGRFTASQNEVAGWQELRRRFAKRRVLAKGVDENVRVDGDQAPRPS